MNNNKVSVVISAYNEEEKIADCLESIKFADEIIFIDNSSSDKTADIAKKYTSKIYKRENNPMLNVNKNFGFTKATGDWILSLDADERVTPELEREIKNILLIYSVDSHVSQSKAQNDNIIDGYWIPRKNIIFGKWIKSDMWWPDYQLRLFRKEKGQFPEKHVHEYIEVKGETAKLKEPMIHENYSTVSQFLYKLDKIYTENEVKSILESGKKVTWIDCLRFPVGDFLKTYFLQKGYKEGIHGLVLSLLQAFYMEVVFAKVWEKQGFRQDAPENTIAEFYKEFKKIKHEFQYWFLTVFKEESNSRFKKFYYTLLRKNVKRKI